MTAQTYNDFAELPDAARALMDTSAGGSFDQTSAWYTLLAGHILEAHESLRILCLPEGGGEGFKAVLPLVLCRNRGSGIFGHTLTSLSNYYTAHFAPALSGGAEPRATADAIADALCGLEDRWHSLDLNPLGDGEPWVECLVQSLRLRGCSVYRYVRFGNWYLDVRDMSFAEYFEALPSKVRNTVARKQRKLEREAEMKIEIVTSPADTARVIKAYESIYRKSWKQDEPHPEFIEEVAKAFAERGWLRLGLLTVDGQPAAAQVWFVRDGTASIFKLAYDPEFGRYSAGSILTRAMMQYVIDSDEVTTVDYLCGDDSYKQDWMSARRVRIGLRAYRRTTLVGAARAGCEYALTVLKRWRRTGMPAPDATGT